MKKVAIVQPNYIPWKGYFDMINMVDEFILYDEVQYTHKDWRNRNYIKTLQGVLLLSIPVLVSSQSQKIYEIYAVDDHWRKKHWKSILINYSKAKYFEQYKTDFEALYLQDEEKHLVSICEKFIAKINEILDIKTRIIRSTAIPKIINDRMGRVREIIIARQSKYFINGPKAKDYMKDDEFVDDGITIEWMHYDNYPVYNQLFPPFTHQVSILDLIFNEGEQAKNFMKSFKQKN